MAKTSKSHRSSPEFYTLSFENFEVAGLVKVLPKEKWDAKPKLAQTSKARRP